MVESEWDEACHDGSFFTGLCIYAVSAKFTAEQIKNSREVIREKSTLKTPFRLQKEKPRTYWCSCKIKRHKGFSTGQWVCESGLFSSPLPELYSSLA